MGLCTKVFVVIKIFFHIVNIIICLGKHDFIKPNHKGEQNEFKMMFLFLHPLEKKTFQVVCTSS